MPSQLKIYRKRWQHFDDDKKRGFILRVIASTIVFILGCGVIFNMRATFIGENGASVAMYFLGVLFVQAMNIAIFYKKLLRPEAFALKICIALVIVAGAWVNIEEKIVMPLLATGCQEDCVIIYERAVPFTDAIAVYQPERGWRILD